MAEHRVLLQANNIFNDSIADVRREVSFDRGQTFRTLLGAELSKGFTVSVGQPFVARVSRPHHWPVTQPLIVTNDVDPVLEFDGPSDFGSEALTTISKAKPGTDTMHVYTAWSTVFRAGEAVRAANGNAPPPPFIHSLLAFGAKVLKGNGTGYGRFDATVAEGVKSLDPSVGRLLFAMTPDKSVPQWVAVFLPNGVDLTQPLPVHVFFSPSTIHRIGPYPFTNGITGFNAVFADFLTAGSKRLINQNVVTGKKCALVFPLAPPAEFFSGIDSAPRLRRYCLELVYLLQKTAGGQRFPAPALGHCMLSAFSAGGIPLFNVISSASGDAFPELKEVCCLDIVAPDDSTSNVTSYQRVADAFATWQAAGAGRRVRIYTQIGAFHSSTAPAAISLNPITSGTGVDHENGKSSFAFLPLSFWKDVAHEQVGVVPTPLYDFGGLETVDDLTKLTAQQVRDLFFAIHQLIPCVFMEHAVVNSDFEPL